MQQAFSYFNRFNRVSACNAMHSIAKAFLFVCLSVCQTNALRQNERNLCPHSYTTWKVIHLSFLTRRMVCGDPLTLLERKRGFFYFQSIFTRSASAVTPSEKVQLTLIGHAFNEPKVNIIRCS